MRSRKFHKASITIQGNSRALRKHAFIISEAEDAIMLDVMPTVVSHFSPDISGAGPVQSF